MDDEGPVQSAGAVPADTVIAVTSNRCVDWPQAGF